MRESIVEHGGYRIRIKSCGPASGPHAVLLPGMGATAVALAPQARALRGLGYSTHIIELPGFGLAPALRKSDARFTQLADLVLHVIGTLGIERALFLGHSLGGGIALQIALRRPAAVEGLVLVAPAGLGRSMLWAYKLYCVPLIGRALLRPYDHGTGAMLRRFLIGRVRRNDSHFIDQLLRRDRRSPATTRSIRAIVWANQPSRWRRLFLLPLPGGEQLGYTLRGKTDALRDIPTLVLWGRTTACSRCVTLSSSAARTPPPRCMSHAASATCSRSRRRPGRTSTSPGSRRCTSDRARSRRSPLPLSQHPRGLSW